jgi:hypothetical protein
MPPSCPRTPRIDRFAERDGQLVRDTAAEYAELLAALIIEQLATLRAQ